LSLNPIIVPRSRRNYWKLWNC